MYSDSPTYEPSTYEHSPIQTNLWDLEVCSRGLFVSVKVNLKVHAHWEFSAPGLEAGFPAHSKQWGPFSAWSERGFTTHLKPWGPAIARVRGNPCFCL